ncbi:MAG: bifunctional (p)ppGpp synthetase/guanosine-3',5'-bis(diphosphate) 3'-pyrophosphohydrolase [Deltaproteobacteria bacterium]|nr:bifunctional (p)ppGpp synthetase/guanosine-3',5'-bis(diphosphate) 3'-pyrophosphohydrolase [Deltaproteobacteria bacterium]
MTKKADFFSRMGEQHPELDTEFLKRVHDWAVSKKKAALGSGEAEGHPDRSLEVASILADMKLDTVSVAAGLLRDAAGENGAAREEIETLFGADLAGLVHSVSRISGLSFNSGRERQAEIIRKMILAMSTDLRVILIHLADLLYRMRNIEGLAGERQSDLAGETLEIYAPIASRLGIYWIKKELEDRALKVLHPTEYSAIESRLITERGERDIFIAKVKAEITQRLARDGITAEVKGRYKHIYSIFTKMRRQNLPFEEIYDIIAFRVIVESVPQCYQGLGSIHSLWKPVENKFKDYISRPKSNMYQSLHTTVIGPGGRRMEVQIRTGEMDAIAESGVAAHWSYKEGRRPDPKTLAAIAWVQNIVDQQQSITDPSEFLDNVRIELFPDEIYLFTPKGDVLALPKGATPVDFAFAVHTQVGHTCVGAKINGRMVPLKTRLETGDSVEIITAKNQHPRKDWLTFVKTVKARARIRQWIKTEERERSLSMGRELCEKLFRRNKLSLNSLIKSDKWPDVLCAFGVKATEDLLVEVGYGKVTPLQILNRLLPKEGDEEKKCELPASEAREAPRKKVGGGITVRGADGILLRFAKCCNPVPGDAITGYITRGFGVTVHRASCPNARAACDLERVIEVAWEGEPEAAYPVRLRIISRDRVGLLADITAAITKMKANILSVNSTSDVARGMADGIFIVAVPGRKQLDLVVKEIRKIQGVQDVKRLGG